MNSPNIKSLRPLLSLTPVQRDLKLPKLSNFASKTPRLDLSPTVKSKNLSLPRFSTPSQYRVLQSSLRFSPSLTATDPQAILEKITQQEQMLSENLKELSNDPAFKKVLMNYWHFCEESSLWSLEKWSKDQRIIKAMQVSMIIEAIAVSLLIHLLEISMLTEQIMPKAKNMMIQVHQSLLITAELIIQQMPLHDSTTPIASSLKAMIKLKKSKSVKRSEYCTSLNHNTELISNSIKSITHSISSTKLPILSVISHVLTNLDKFSIKSARAYLFPQELTPKIQLSPYLDLKPNKEFTLVLDLDETLVHYNGSTRSGELLVRPYCEEFLNEMASIFEVTVFTAGLQEYADWAVSLIDRKHVVRFRMYRQHTVQNGRSFIKDLDRLGRDLAKTVIVDNVQANFQLQKDNGILIKTWLGDETDEELKKLAKVLKGMDYIDITEKFKEDIRVGIKLYKDSIVS